MYNVYPSFEFIKHHDADLSEYQTSCLLLMNTFPQKVRTQSACSVFTIFCCCLFSKLLR